MDDCGERRSRALGGPRKPVGVCPTPHELRAFVHLCEELHFGRAAGRLGVAQSSLSETIRRLEAKVDAVLLERSSRRVVLTNAGAALLPVAREVLERLDTVATAVTAAGEPAEELFRVGIEGQGIAELNRVVLSGFRTRHPDLRLAVRELVGDPQAFLNGRFDAGLVRTPFEDERLTVYPVATEERGLLVPACHPAAGAEGLSAVEFLDEPFVELLPHRPATSTYWIGAELRGGDRPRVGGTACDAQDAVMAIAYLGLLTTGSASAMRSFPFVPISYVGTVDLTPETLSVAVRAGDDRLIVREFVQAVQAVVARFAGDVPRMRALSLN